MGLDLYSLPYEKYYYKVLVLSLRSCNLKDEYNKKENSKHQLFGKILQT